MGKIRRNKSYRVHQAAIPVVKKAADPDDILDSYDDVEEETGASMSALSRGQRKRQKRRDAFLKKMGMVQRSTLQREKENKKEKIAGMFGDLEDLQKSLFAIQASSKAQEKTDQTKSVSQMTGKQKKRLIMHELVHLKAVHTHPAFKANPFAAIQMHLQNTVLRGAQHSNAEATSVVSTPKKSTKIEGQKVKR
jgi:hypothetical protein